MLSRRPSRRIVPSSTAPYAILSCCMPPATMTAATAASSVSFRGTVADRGEMVCNWLAASHSVVIIRVSTMEPRPAQSRASGCLHSAIRPAMRGSEPEASSGFNPKSSVPEQRPGLADFGWLDFTPPRPSNAQSPSVLLPWKPRKLEPRYSYDCPSRHASWYLYTETITSAWPIRHQVPIRVSGVDELGLHRAHLLGVPPLHEALR